jgi:hypothetical protein
MGQLQEEDTGDSSRRGINRVIHGTIQGEDISCNGGHGGQLERRDIVHEKKEEEHTGFEFKEGHREQEVN